MAEGDGAPLVVLVQVGALQLQHAQYAPARDLATHLPKARGRALRVAKLLNSYNMDLIDM